MQTQSIRHGSVEDLPELLTLIQEFAHFQKVHGITNTLSQLHEDLDCFEFLAAFIDGAMCGYLVYFEAYATWTGKAIYIDDFYLQPHRRKLGLGKEMFEMLVNVAKSRHYKVIKWQVSHWNKNAIEFYRKLGAEINNEELNCRLELI